MWLGLQRVRRCCKKVVSSLHYFHNHLQVCPIIVLTFFSCNNQCNLDLQLRSFSSIVKDYNQQMPIVPLGFILKALEILNIWCLSCSHANVQFDCEIWVLLHHFLQTHLPLCCRFFLVCWAGSWKDRYSSSSQEKKYEYWENIFLHWRRGITLPETG